MPNFKDLYKLIFVLILILEVKDKQGIKPLKESNLKGFIIT